MRPRRVPPRRRHTFFLPFFTNGRTASGAISFTSCLQPGQHPGPVVSRAAGFQGMTMRGLLLLEEWNNQLCSLCSFRPNLHLAALVHSVQLEDQTWRYQRPIMVIPIAGAPLSTGSDNPALWHTDAGRGSSTPIWTLPLNLVMEVAM